MLPIYSLHVYDTFNVGITEANLMLVKFPRTLISQFSTVLSYTLLVSVNKVKSQTRTLVSTNVVCFLLHQNYFTSLRTSTVLGRFYYGISRHSTPVYFFTEIYWRQLLYPTELTHSIPPALRLHFTVRIGGWSPYGFFSVLDITFPVVISTSRSFRHTGT